MGLDRWCLAAASFFTKTTGNKKPAQQRGFFVGFFADAKVWSSSTHLGSIKPKPVLMVL
jgi:hypothetical protein